ncbi:hypothetical protein [Paenibacillus harenae]|uniref:hypothetical protein n=1 Tax=Paenibacillus harenae TaxID=306543 RepID=UPI002792A869|nr:hypothetical protein [Paenibacillus harenae]MDQ0059987.1 hypothetical protein [Paenibacillus harenae]
MNTTTLDESPAILERGERMFKWFKRTKSISGAEQYSKLKEIGIMLIKQEYFDLSKSEYKKNPYMQLLISMGSEVENSNDIIYPSNNVWYLDRECIEDHGDYVSIVERIAEIIKEEVVISNIQDYVDIENKKARISFLLNDLNYEYELNVINDWVDLSILEYFSKLLAESGSEYRFFFSDIDQSVLVVFIKKGYYYQLNKLLNIFIPAYLREGRPII